MDKNGEVATRELTGLWRQTDLVPIIDTLSSHRYLHLSIPSDYNELNHEMLAQLCRLTNITELSLGDLALHRKWDLYLTTIQRLPLLTKLEFLLTTYIDTSYRDPITYTTDLSVLTALHKIKEFNASHFEACIINQQTTLKHLTSLTSLEIRKEAQSELISETHLDSIVNKHLIVNLDLSGFANGLSKAHLFKNVTSLVYQAKTVDITHVTLLADLRSLKLATPEELQNLERISALTSLRTLSIRAQSLDISSFTALTDLQELSLTGSDLTNQNNVQSPWNDLPHLKWLTLGGKIHSEDILKLPKTLETFKCLSNLNEHTKMDLAGLPEISSLSFMNGTPDIILPKTGSALTSLHVTGCNVGLIGLLTRFGNLRVLHGDFKEPSIPDKHLNCADISHLTNLVSLHINIPLTESLKGLERLTSLSFSGHHADPLASILGSFSALKALRLSCEQIGKIGEALKHLPNLETINISQATDVTAKLFKHFKSLTQLKIVRVVPGSKSKLLDPSKFLHRFIVLKNLRSLELGRFHQYNITGEILHFCTQLRNVTIDGQTTEINPVNRLTWGRGKGYKAVQLDDLLKKK